MPHYNTPLANMKLSEEEVAKLEAEGDLPDLSPLAIPDSLEVTDETTGPTTEQLQRQSRRHLDSLQPDMDRVAAIKAERIDNHKSVTCDEPVLPAGRLRNPFSPHPTHVKRIINLRFLAKDIGQPIIDLICKRYTDHVPLEAILKQANEKIKVDKLEPLAIIDLFAIIADQVIREKIKPRKFPAGELSIHKFNQFYETWKNGGSLQQCMARIHPFRSKYFIHKCHRALSERYRATRKQEMSTAIRQEAAITMKVVDKTILRFATRQVIDDVSCLVIPVRKLPPNILMLLKEIPHAKNLIETADALQDQADIHKISRETEKPLEPPRLNLRSITEIGDAVTEHAEQAELPDEDVHFSPTHDTDDTIANPPHPHPNPSQPPEEPDLPSSGDNFDAASLDDLLTPEQERLPEGTPDPFEKE